MKWQNMQLSPIDLRNLIQFRENLTQFKKYLKAWKEFAPFSGELILKITENATFQLTQEMNLNFTGNFMI